MAAIACIFVIGLTQSFRETRLLFLGLGFLSIASIFAVHGFGTPGHFHSEAYAELSISSWLSVIVGAFFICLSVVPLPEKAEAFVTRRGGYILGGTALLMGVYIGLSFAAENWMSFIPYQNRDLQLAGTAITLALLAFSAVRYFQAFLFARLFSQWAMFCLVVLLMEVQISMTFGRYWSYSLVDLPRAVRPRLPDPLRRLVPGDQTRRQRTCTGRGAFDARCGGPAESRLLETDCRTRRGD